MSRYQQELKHIRDLDHYIVGVKEILEYKLETDINYRRVNKVIELCDFLDKKVYEIHNIENLLNEIESVREE